MVYTAKRVPEGSDVFELSLQLPEKAGETLALPGHPDVREGTTAWTDPRRVRPGRSLDARLRVDEIAEAVEESRGSAQASPVEADDDSDTGTTFDVIGLVLGALGLVTAGAALFQVRRRA